MLVEEAKQSSKFDFQILMLEKKKRNLIIMIIFL